MDWVHTSCRRLHKFITPPVYWKTPYTAKFQRPPPRDITSLIQFPSEAEYQFDNVKFHNKILERTDKIRQRYKQLQPKPLQYQIGEQVLLKNRELPSTMEGIAKKLLLLYTGPYVVSKDNKNNTYEIIDPNMQRRKGTYNQSSMKKYYKMWELSLIHI